MGKNEGFMTAKAVGKRMKAKGLKKLKWYCQMCEKQCGSENGFKCHQTSEKHLRQMRLFRDNPGKYISNYSTQFETAFMAMLRMRGRKRVKANNIYQEVIADRGHIHMNSTKWNSLSGFVQYLGATGKAIIEETERGWYIQYVDKDPDKMRRQAAMRGHKNADREHDELNERLIRKQIAAAADDDLMSNAVVEKEELKKADGESITLCGLSTKKKSVPSLTSRPNALSMFAPVNESSGDGKKSKSENKVSALDAIIQENEARKKRQREHQTSSAAVEVSNSGVKKMKVRQRKDVWICSGLHVKVMNKIVGDGAYYKKKGVISRVDGYVAWIEMIKSGHVLKIDQAELETVIPAIGKSVRVLCGPHKGCTAIMRSLNVDTFSVNVELTSGTELSNVSYDNVCKLAS